MKILALILLLATAFAARADYAAVLSEHVDEHGMVNYAALKAARAPLDAYVRTLENPDATGWVEADWIAFWINAYNARTLQVIIDHYPTEGIREIRGAWTRLKVPVLGEDRTLDEIEHEILRKEFQEPRIHMALVCAARSCPKLRNEPYVGARLEQQLTDQSRDFLARPDRFRVEGDTAYVSRIFKWFKKDFDSVPAFIQTYSGRDVFNLKIKYQAYDWSLNEQNRRDP